MDDRLYLTLPQPCPGCGAPNDGHYRTSAHRGGPRPGMVSVCATCVTIGIYDESGIRLPTFQEWCRLTTDAEVQRAVRTVKALRRRLTPWMN